MVKALIILNITIVIGVLVSFVLMQSGNQEQEKTIKKTETTKTTATTRQHITETASNKLIAMHNKYISDATGQVIGTWKNINHNGGGICTIYMHNEEYTLYKTYSIDNSQGQKVLTLVEEEGRRRLFIDAHDDKWVASPNTLEVYIDYKLWITYKK